jgi:hypothetical protein
MNVVSEESIFGLLTQLHRLSQLREKLNVYERLLVAETLRTVADQIAPKPSRRFMLLTPKGPRGRPLYRWQ